MRDALENLVHQMYKSGLRYGEAVEEFQKAFLYTALSEQKGNQVRAAQKLRMHRNSLRRLIRDLQLDVRTIREAARRRPPRKEQAIVLSKSDKAI